MSDMKRLKDQPASELARQLLASVKADHSEPGACDRALSAVGLGVTGVAGVAGVVTAKAASTAAGAASGAGPGGSLAPTAVKVGSTIFLKWIGVATLAGGAIVGAAHVVATPAKPLPLAATAPVAVSVATERAAAAGRAAAPARALETEETPFAAPNGSTPAAAPTTAPTIATRHAATVAERPAPAVSVTTAPAALAVVPVAPRSGQLSALHEVRAALGAHDPERALALLDDFARRYPSASLDEEASVLRIDALLDARRREAAHSLAVSFLRTHPASAYREHIQSRIDFSDQN